MDRMRHAQIVANRFTPEVRSGCCWVEKAQRQVAHGHDVRHNQRVRKTTAERTTMNVDPMEPSVWNRRAGRRFAQVLGLGLLLMNLPSGAATREADWAKV